MELSDILKNAYVITDGGDRLKQFRRLFLANNMNPDLVKIWNACYIENEGSMGNAVAQYSLVRHALEEKLPFLVVFEDDVAPCDNADKKLVDAFNNVDKDTLCLSLGWSYDSDPKIGKERGKKRRVYGSQAYVLFGEKAYREYISKWPKNGRADVVLGLMDKSFLNDKNLFAQYTATNNAIHLPKGWTLSVDIENDVDNEALEKYIRSKEEVKKMEEEKTIHVAYTIDIQGQGAVQFMDQLFVSLGTLKEVSKDDGIVMVHILYANIPTNLMAGINKMGTENFKIDWIALSQQNLAFMQSLTKNSPYASVRTWNGVVFARLWIPLFIPTVDKVLYFDNDTMFRKSIKELWETDLKGNPIALAMGSVYEYGYNSGVMVMDCKMMREDKDHYPNLEKFLVENAPKYMLPDQTSINTFFKGRITELDRKWNFPPCPGKREAMLANAAIWHFYEGTSKPYRVDTDDFGYGFLAWNAALARVEGRPYQL